ncbi:hypothetical protein VdG1_00705 [Verticillium dahliae VDG1]|nr:hypothetical protein VdG1_00705 [Verticillium dahliae VDG1]
MATPNPDPPSTAPAFIPLEANPQLMTTLLHKLGLSSALQIHDVYSLTDPDLLAFIPRPALALLLVFPVSATYESHRLAEDALLDDYEGHGDTAPVVWFRQTIRNACGLMGLLHAVANGPARDYIGPAASQGDTSAPEATDDVDLHYVCFVKTTDGAFWELDGRRKGPLQRGQLEESEDVLSTKALTLGPLKFLEREGADLRFSAVALAGATD